MTTQHERDQETGFDYRGARFYDSDIARFLSLDPLATKFPAWSAYNYVMGNPIMLIDPTGKGAEGDYYNKSGKWLGSDGKDDNKAYLADSKNSDGTFSNAKELSLSNSDLKKFAGLVFNEDVSTMESAYATASAVTNYVSFNNAHGGRKTLQGLLNSGYSSASKSFSVDNNNGMKMRALGAAINALTGGYDYSNGATHWDGFDFAAKGLNHIKAREQGIELSAAHFADFKAVWSDEKISAFSGGRYSSFSSNLTSGQHVGGSGRMLYQSSAVHGGTVFWKPNVNAMISSPPLIRDFRGDNSTIITYPNAGYNWKYY